MAEKDARAVTHLPAGVEPVLALVDGLMLQLLTGQVSEEAAVDAFLDRVFG